MSQLENTWKLLQPELLSRDDLIFILQEKNISIQENLDRAQLIEIFKKIAMPYSQRPKYQQLSNQSHFSNNQDAANEVAMYLATAMQVSNPPPNCQRQLFPFTDEMVCSNRENGFSGTKRKLHESQGVPAFSIRPQQSFEDFHENSISCKRKKLSGFHL